MAQITNEQVLFCSFDRMSQKNGVDRAIRTCKKQVCRLTTACERGDEIDRGSVSPMEVFENQNQRAIYGEGLECFAKLTYHAPPGASQDFSLERIPLFCSHVRRKLSQPCGSIFREDFNKRSVF